MSKPIFLLHFLFLLACTLTGQSVEDYAVNVNSKGVILDGYDAVSLRDGQAQRGMPTFSLQYHGATYLFANEKNKQRFEAKPELYEPEFGGYCAYGVATGSLVGIDLSTYDTSFENRNIYNYDKNIARKWKKDPAGWYRKAQKNWPELVAKSQKKQQKRTGQ